MAVYLPAALLPFSSFSSIATYVASSAATTGVIRTIQFNTTTASETATVELGGADAAAQRLIDAYALTVNVPAIFNGWWVQPVTAASLIGAKTSATALSIVTGIISGYTYA